MRKRVIVRSCPQSVDGVVVGHSPEALVLCENSFLGRHDLEHGFERAKTRSDRLASAEAVQLGVEPINPREAAQRANERDWGIRTKEPLVPSNPIFPAFQRVEFAGDQPLMARGSTQTGLATPRTSIPSSSAARIARRERNPPVSMIGIFNRWRSERANSKK